MKKILIILAVLFSGGLQTAHISAQTMADYTAYPPFIMPSATPNVLIIQDNSGSMNMPAYDNDDDYKTTDNGFDSTKTYYGYFDPLLKYDYDSSGTRPACGGKGCFYSSGPGAWSGNFLNWVTMRRIDISRKVLAGGKAVTRSPGAGVNYALEGEVPPDNGACCRTFVKQYNGTYYGVYADGKIYVDNTSMPFNIYGGGHGRRMGMDKDDCYDGMGGMMGGMGGMGGWKNCGDGSGAANIYNIIVEVGSSPPEGIIQKMGDKVRFGLEVFNLDQGGRIEKYINFDDFVYTDNGLTQTHIKHLVYSIENLHPETWTPLAESLYEGAMYFKQNNPQEYFTTDYDLSSDSYKDPYYFTDIGATVSCCESFVIMITDGESTQDLAIPAAKQNYDGDSNDPGSYSSNGSDYLDDVALWAHTTDLRSDLNPEEQNITLYAVFAFGSGSQLLKDAAKNGGFIDENSTNTPDLQSEWDADNDGIPDTYLEAQEGDMLEAAILSAIDDIFKRSASSGSASVVTASGGGEGSVFQAYFMPSKDGVAWLGYLQALWVDPGGNLREDSNGDGKQILTEDKIIIFDNTTGKINRYGDSDGDGVPDGTPEEISLDAISPIWEAGKKLAERDVSASPRNIYTFVDANEDNWCKPAWAACSSGDGGDFIEFKDTNASTLKPYLRADDTGLYTADNIINFIRGGDISGLRNRTIGAGEWRLGDIIYSTPTVVGRPMENMDFIYADKDYLDFRNLYKDRETVVYVGANDGMLHAFRAGIYHAGDKSGTSETEYGWYEDSNNKRGEELWAYIPYDLLPHLKWLTNKYYSHVYYVDLNPKVLDAKIFTPDSSVHPGGWGTVLIAGMRFGGGELTINNFNNSGSARTFRSAYFALDITVPSSPKFLWRFTDPDLGFTMSYPAVAKVDNNWFVIVGSGPTDYDGTSDQTGHIFIVDLKTGELKRRFDRTESNAFMADPITVDVDLKINDVGGSYATEVAYIGETYKESGAWKGKMFRISMEDDSSPANWDVSTLYDTGTGKSITAAPTTAMNSNKDLWVYFGTGRFLSTDDKTDTNGQSFYGIKEKCWNGSIFACTDTITALYDSSNVVVYEGGEVSTGGNFNDLINDIAAGDGWYIDFSLSGERSLTKPVMFGGMVLFTTFVPDTNICSYGGDGYLYALYYETGTAYEESIMGTDPGTVNADGDEKVLSKVSLGSGSPSQVGLHMGTGETLGGGGGGAGALDVSCGGAANGSGSRLTGFIQGGSGQITQQTLGTAINTNSRVISWKEK